MIDWIVSADDPRLDPYRHVANPHWIREHGLFVAEGRLVVERLLALDRFRVHSILVNRAAHDAMRSAAVGGARDRAGVRRPDARIDHRLQLSPRLPGARPPSRGRCVPAALPGARRLLGIENVANPDNIGGLFRTAAAFGVDGVVLDATSGDPLYRKAIRTSMGASLRVPFARAEAWLPALAELPRAGLQDRGADAGSRRADAGRVRGDRGEPMRG